MSHFSYFRLCSRQEPEYDSENYELNVTEVLVDGDWTSVTFARYFMELDDVVSSRRTINITFDGNATRNGLALRSVSVGLYSSRSPRRLLPYFDRHALFYSNLD